MATERDEWTVGLGFGEMILEIQGAGVKAAASENIPMMLKLSRQIVSLLNQRATEKLGPEVCKGISNSIQKAELLYMRGSKNMAYNEAVQVQEKANDLVMKLGVIYPERRRGGVAEGRAG